MNFGQIGNKMDAPQKWFQGQKRTSFILRCTFQNMYGKQAFLNDLCCCRKVMIRSILENNFTKRYKQYVIHKLDK